MPGVLIIFVIIALLWLAIFFAVGRMKSRARRHESKPWSI